MESKISVQVEMVIGFIGNLEIEQNYKDDAIKALKKAIGKYSEPMLIDDMPKKDKVSALPKKQSMKLVHSMETEENLKEIYKNEKNIFFFPNEEMRAIWKEELTGQISDGMWENTNNTNWEFWCNLATAVDTDLVRPLITGKKPWKTTKYNFSFGSLVEVVGDDILATAQKVNDKYTYKQMRVDLVAIKEAMKRFGGIAKKN